MATPQIAGGLSLAKLALRKEEILRQPPSKMVWRGGRILDPASKTDRVGDIYIAAGKIAAICLAGEATPAALASFTPDLELDVRGLWILPGLIDMHVHLREPGEEYKEDIASGSLAAVAGGFTTILAMPNTKPVLDRAELIKFVLERGKQVGLSRVLVSGAVTVGQRGELLAPYGELQRAGAIALTDDGRAVVRPALMRAALEYSQHFNLPILTHAEEPTLAGVMHEGCVSRRLGLAGTPRSAEDIAVARDILLAAETGGRLHVCHVSSKGAVELIRTAKAQGIPVTGEAAPHHFSLTDAAVEAYNTFAKMNPPLREDSDRLAVIQGLQDGTLEVIATDHAPHSPLEKAVPFAEAACGVIGLQTALPLSLELFRADHLSLLQVIASLTEHPAKVLGLAEHVGPGIGRLQPQGLADVVVVDPEAVWECTEASLHSKSKNSPFLGRKLRGKVELCCRDGKIVYLS